MHCLLRVPSFTLQGPCEAVCLVCVWRIAKRTELRERRGLGGRGLLTGSTHTVCLALIRLYCWPVLCRRRVFLDDHTI